MNLGAGSADVPFGLVRRGETPKGFVIGVRDAAVGIELGEDELQIGLETTDGGVKIPILKAVWIDLVIEAGPEGVRHRVERGVIGVGNAAVEIELRKRRVKINDRLLDLVDEIDLIIPARLIAFIFSVRHEGTLYV